MNNYTISFFRESLPSWKKKRDPIMVRYVYRPISYYFSAVFSNIGLSANDVSNLSTVVGIIGCIFFLIPNYICGIIGAIIVNLWITLDCTDGNIARAIKKMPYGEFVDATSCYVLVGILFNVLGFRAYHIGSCIFSGQVIIILFGALASTFDSLMRLIFQKYLVSSYDIGINEKIDSNPENVSLLQKIRIKIDLNFGIGGFLPIILLLGVIFSFLDIIVIVWMLYYGLVCGASSLYLIIKATKYGNKNSLKD